MSVKRIADPAGIQNDLIVVDLSDADGEDERAAIIEILKGGDPEPRIAKLRGIPELASRVAWLDRHLASVGEDRALHERLRDAEAIAYKLAAQPALVRDRKRQAGTKKPRRPDIDEWIDRALKRDPDAKSPALWAIAPDSITDQIGEDRFKKRVSSARKRVASK
jgi:hypothetical protein